RRCRHFIRDNLSSYVVLLEPETSADDADSSIPAQLLLDGAPPLQDHGHSQPDASTGEA
ncbi:hypothetical protein ATANTOWER_007710, partial [Ataeniobius toweri]|nr:hypothetical protein [Ataeniobius toweri]